MIEAINLTQRMRKMVRREEAQATLDELSEIPVATMPKHILAVRQQLILLSKLLPGEKSSTPSHVIAPDSGMVNCYVAQGVFGQSENGGRVSNKGRDGDQQDSFAVLRDQGFYIVADGVGGNQGGADASSLALGQFVLLISSGEKLDRSFWLSNNLIKQYKDLHKLPKGAGTTMSVLQLNGYEAQAFSVGDSPIYWWHQGELSLMTRPHSGLLYYFAEREVQTREMLTNLWLQDCINPLIELVYGLPPYSAEIIDALHQIEGAYYLTKGFTRDDLDWRRRVLTAYAGITHVVAGDDTGADYFKSDIVEAMPGDSFLVCSDGVALSSQQIKQVLMSPLNPVLKVRQLITLATTTPAMDNATAILVEVR